MYDIETTTHNVSNKKCYDYERKRDHNGEAGKLELENSKIIFYKDCSLGSVKTCLTTSPC